MLVQTARQYNSGKSDDGTRTQRTDDDGRLLPAEVQARARSAAAVRVGGVNGTGERDRRRGNSGARGGRDRRRPRLGGETGPGNEAADWPADRGPPARAVFTFGPSPSLTP